MILVLALIGAGLLLAALLLEEASAWFAGHGVALIREDDDDPAGIDLAYQSRESRLLAHLLGAGGFLALVLAARETGVAWAAPAAAAAGVVGAGVAAALVGTNWRSPLNLPGRALLRPFRWIGFASRILLRFIQRIRGLETEVTVGDRILGADRELRWLQGRAEEDAAGRVLATLHEFGESQVEDVLVPRNEISGLAAGTPVSAALETVREEGFSRYPVYRESIDNIVGVLHVFDLLDAPSDADVAELARKPLLTNATRPVADLLRDLQISYNQLAVVVDEFGGTAGVVTIEDLMEELVGEIRDETDDEEVRLRLLEPGVYWVDASMRIDELNEILELELDEGEYDTIAGLVLERLERVPRPGERIEAEDVEIEVASAEPNRILSVRVTLVGAR